MYRSETKALTKVTAIKVPMVTLGGWTEKSMIRKPKNKIMLVKQIAFPVSLNVISRASFLSFVFSKANLYLLKKWIESSTAIPKMSANTIDITASNLIPTNPISAAAKIKGRMLGTSEINNILTFLKSNPINMLIIIKPKPRP